MLKRKIKVYLSHPIRGILREKATEETMKANNQKAIDWDMELWGGLNRPLSYVST